MGYLTTANCSWTGEILLGQKEKSAGGFHGDVVHEPSMVKVGLRWWDGRVNGAHNQSQIRGSWDTWWERAEHGHDCRMTE